MEEVYRCESFGLIVLGEGLVVSYGKIVVVKEVVFVVVIFSELFQWEGVDGLEVVDLVVLLAIFFNEVGIMYM